MRRWLIVGAIVGAAAATVAAAATLTLTTATLGITSKTLHAPVTCTVTSGSSSTTHEENPQQTGESTVLPVESRTGHAVEGWLKFDFSSCDFPTGSVVDSATLKIAAQGGSHHTVGLYRVASDWSASSITWSNQPSTSSSPSATVTFSSNNRLYSADVSTDVADYLAGDAPNAGWMIADIASNSSDQVAVDGTSHGSEKLRPTLSIVYVY